MSGENFSIENLPLIYIAGPFRGENVWAMVQNIRAAERVALQVWCAGAVAICPHLNTANFDKRLPDQTFVDGTKAMLLACDGMLVLPDWERSAGTRGEIALAEARGIPYRVLYDCDYTHEALLYSAVHDALVEMGDAIEARRKARFA